MKKLLILSICLLAIGCQPSSIKITHTIDCNEPDISATGESAKLLAQKIASNYQTKEGRLNEMLKYNGWLYAVLIIIMVLGIAFWAFTKSRYGFIAPVAAFCGIAFITFWAQYAKAAVLIIGILAGVVIVYKAVEYQMERDEEKVKNGHN